MNEYTLSQLTTSITDGKHGGCKEVSGSGYYFISVKDLADYEIDYSNAKQISKEDFDETVARASIEAGDTVYANTGDTIGKCVFIRENELNTKTTFQKSVAILKANSEIVSPRFLFYLLKNETRGLREVATGSAQKNLLLSSMRNYKVRIPEMQTQIKISELLGTIDDVIFNNALINQNLQEQARAIYSNMIVDSADDTWTQGTLSDVAHVTMGQSPKGDTYNEDGNGTVFFQGRTEFGFRFPTRRLYTTDPKRMAQANDALMSVRAPVGDMNVAYEDCCIGRGLSAIRSKDGHQSFVLYTMFDLRDQLDVFNGEGTVFGSINRDALNSMPISIPPESVLDAFEAVVAPMDQAIRNNYQEICRLTNIRDSLLPLLMSGELDVSEIDL